MVTFSILPVNLKFIFSSISRNDNIRRDAAWIGKASGGPIADRPGRIEPCVLKRRLHRYPLMQRPRNQLRQELQKGNLLS